MHRSPKPVRRCHGCGLNMGERCGVFNNPHEMWHQRTQCPGYMNQAMLEEFLQTQSKKQEKVDKLKRRTIAHQRRSINRKNGDRHVVMIAK